MILFGRGGACSSLFVRDLECLFAKTVCFACVLLSVRTQTSLAKSCNQKVRIRGRRPRRSVRCSPTCKHFNFHHLHLFSYCGIMFSLGNLIFIFPCWKTNLGKRCFFYLIISHGILNCLAALEETLFRCVPRERTFLIFTTCICFLIVV